MKINWTLEVVVAVLMRHPSKPVQIAALLAIGIAAITLFVEDLAAAKQFYLNVFGLPVVFEGDTSTVFKFGNTLINLLKSRRRQNLLSLQRWQAARRALALSSPSTWMMSMPCVPS